MNMRDKSVSALLIGAAVLTASCATAPPQAAGPAPAATPERLIADRALANAVYSKLNADPYYYYRHVEVKVDDDGVAHLSGYVWSADAIFAARRLASSVPGVTGVVTNQLELERNGPSNGVAR
ncbi:MAG TPA: BON domain-containing protein [Steroidobacteraceae bacterium]|nr:BON domain-containing protein [Steroidobacteraceae bacterium]